MSRPQIKNCLTTRQVAVLLGVCLRTVQLWSDRDTSAIPFQRTAGGHRRYSETEVRAWAAVHNVFVVQGPSTVDVTRKKLLTFLGTVLAPEEQEMMRHAALELHATLGTTTAAEALAILKDVL